jgi:hypothetical protein
VGAPPPIRPSAAVLGSAAPISTQNPSGAAGESVRGVPIDSAGSGGDGGVTGSRSAGTGEIDGGAVGSGAGAAGETGGADSGTVGWGGSARDPGGAFGPGVASSPCSSASYGRASVDRSGSGICRCMAMRDSSFRRKTRWSWRSRTSRGKVVPQDEHRRCDADCWHAAGPIPRSAPRAAGADERPARRSILTVTARS